MNLVLQAGFVLLLPALAFAHPQSQSQPQPATPPTFAVTVIETAPLPGVDLPIDKVPAPVQTATAKDIQDAGALDPSDFLNRRVAGAFVNEMQGNPFQPDVNFRGYTASPLLGTPQGVSVYMDGVRLNQPFGDVVSWDLIPRMAIESVTVMPGSNPLFGLNTLGGALSLQTKDGRSDTGTDVQAMYGSSQRRQLEVEHGGRQRGGGLNWYVAGSLFAEDGWRDDSPSDVRQIFGKLGWQRAASAVSLTLAHADNSLTGNGLQDQRLLARDYASVYTKPDQTDNRSTFASLSARRTISGTIVLSANGYYRDIQTGTFNGDINDDALVLRAAEAAQGSTGNWANGLINRTDTTQHQGGASGQLTWRDTLRGRDHQFTLGGAYDYSRAGFEQSSELGYLNSDRSVTGLGLFEDPVDLDGRVNTWSLYATDTLAFGSTWNVTLSGRYNRTSLHNRDRIEPGGGPDSLDGDHVFQRFNPAVGVTFVPSPALTVYAGYSEGSRAATSVELGCANPDEPCKLPNAMAGDPPLNQVVTRTWESGLRGRLHGVSWNAGVFRAENRDDILFVTSDRTGFGYFKNFGETRRQGLEIGATRRLGRAMLGGGYTFLDATYQTEETVNGENNSRNDAAEDGEPGVDGTIQIAPGNRIPLLPRHVAKAYADVQLTPRLSTTIGLIAASGSYARGNENNQHEPDGLYYLAHGLASGYAITNLDITYRLTASLQLLARVNNLFDQRYNTAAQLGPAGFTPDGTFNARPFPRTHGEYPLQRTTFYAPGAPARIWFGARCHF